ncbi:hypothetical protein HDU79_000663 [Rhizoclosmatium sp. JEL0117]|nr:hypothetical protein HDU79_000663 [Rhizoclosmatium sp. JEL0117]
MFMWTNTESGCGCVYGTWFENLAWHLYFVIADAYILIKANTVAKNNKVYSVFAVGSFLYRIGWTIPDLVWVRGVWNADEKLCEYFSSPLSGLNCAVADILCDIVASFLVLAVFLQKKRLDPEATGVTLWQLLLKENMIRSILALFVNSFILWANLNVDDINILFIFYGLQNYTYIQLMNLELYWKRVREEFMKTSSIQTPSIPSSNEISSFRPSTGDATKTPSIKTTGKSQVQFKNLTSMDSK